MFWPLMAIHIVALTMKWGLLLTWPVLSTNSTRIVKFWKNSQYLIDISKYISNLSMKSSQCWNLSVLAFCHMLITKHTLRSQFYASVWVFQLVLKKSQKEQCSAICHLLFPICLYKIAGFCKPKKEKVETAKHTFSFCLIKFEFSHFNLLPVFLHSKMGEMYKSVNAHYSANLLAEDWGEKTFLRVERLENMPVQTFWREIANFSAWENRGYLFSESASPAGGFFGGRES